MRIVRDMKILRLHKAAFDEQKLEGKKGAIAYGNHFFYSEEPVSTKQAHQINAAMMRMANK